MLDVEFFDHMADFYGSQSLDELAERLGVPSEELLEELETLIDRNLDAIKEEMGYDNGDNENDDDEGED